MKMFHFDQKNTTNYTILLDTIERGEFYYLKISFRSLTVLYYNNILQYIMK